MVGVKLHLVNLTKFVSVLDLTDSRVDRNNNIIHGVSLVSLGEARGHNKIADDRTLEQVRDCAKQYKGGLRVKFNPNTFNHGDAGLAGTIPGDSIHITDGKVIGDMHVYDSYPNKDYLYEIAERAPDNFGLSIEFSGMPEQIDGIDFARCDEIFAATLVDLPAANPTGLFAAKAPYGDVHYADPGYQEDKQKRYPVDTADHVRAAWSYINQEKNAGQYSSGDLTKVKNSIKAAAKKFGIEIEGENMSMTDEQVKTLGEQIVTGLTKGLTPVLTKFRMGQDTPATGDPTDDELDAAGCTDDDTEEQKTAKVSDYRARLDQPVTVKSLRKEMMEMFRHTGGPPAKSGGESTTAEKKMAAGDGKFESLVTEFKQRNPDVSPSAAILEVRKANNLAYNEYCKRGRPEITFK